MARNIVERILDKIVEDENGCWIFIGRLDYQGYGRIACRKVNGQTVDDRAHRVMYMAFNGDIPDGLVVRHRCDIMRCCNPKHLVLGTQKDNIHDQIARGRHTSQRRYINAPF
jgi:hypothetical protein